MAMLNNQRVYAMIYSCFCIGQRSPNVAGLPAVLPEEWDFHHLFVRWVITTTTKKRPMAVSENGLKRASPKVAQWFDEENKVLNRWKFWNPTTFSPKDLEFPPVGATAQICCSANVIYPPIYGIPNRNHEVPKRWICVGLPNIFS